MSPIPFAQVNRDNRVRIAYEEIPDLADSIYTMGLIHPICINQNNELVAGGRRTAALQYLLDYPTLFPYSKAHPTMVSFIETQSLTFGVHYTSRTTETIDELSELELIENIQRHNFSWQEEVLATQKIHLLKVRAVALGQIADYTAWGQRQTGRLLKISVGNVNYCLDVASHLKSADSPLWKLSSLTEAFHYLTKVRLDEASLELAAKLKARASVLPSVPAMQSTAAFMTSFDPSAYQSGEGVGIDNSEFGPPPTTTTPSTSSIVEPDKQPIALPDGMDIISRMVFNAKWEEFQTKMGNGFADHILCDPPFAIDMGNLAQAGGGGQQDIDRIAHTHDKDQNKEDFEVWLKCCYDALKERGFCVWFCDIEHFDYLVKLGFKIGFKVQRWPFHWIKTTSCMNQRAEYNFTKSVEHAIIFRKGNAKLVSAQSNNWWMGGLQAEDKAALPNHPFIKPAALWQHIAKAIALPGSTIVDGFSGVGSMPRAMMLGGWQPLTCEMDPVHYSAQLHNLTTTYNKMRA